MLSAFSGLKADAVAERTANSGNVVLEDVPEIPQSIRNDLRRYQNVRSAGVLDWTADGSGLYISTRFAEVSQIHRVNQPGGTRQQLTWFDEPVGSVQRQPESDTLAFLRDEGGSEFSQIFLLDPDTGEYRMLSDGESRNGAILWSEDGQVMAFQSTRRNGRSNDVWVQNIAEDSEPEMILESPDGTWWGPIEFSPDGSKLLVLQYISVNDSRIHLINLASGERRQIIGSQGEPNADDASRYLAYGFAADGQGIYLATDAGQEFAKLAYLSLEQGAEPQTLSDDIDWSVTSFAINHAGDEAALITNEDGISRLYRMELPSGEPERIDTLPVGLAGGLEFSPDDQQLAMTINNATTPSDVFVMDWAGDKSLTRWTYSEVGGLNTVGFASPELIHYPTFDEVDGQPRKIPAFVYRPQGEGPFPVVVSIHGGPEGQSRPGFSSTFQLWVDRLGAAVVVPNVRGSSGYGKSFLKMDNGFLREDSVKDIGALLDWIAEQPDLDQDRVAVYGGSYGGYMVLASAVHYSDKLKAAVNIVGISNFVTFLENTQDYRRDLRRVEYGDERDPDMRAHLEAISPLNNVEKIDVPLFVVQGNNDPRVPVTEAEQIVAALREQGSPVWYMNALNEGHGFRKKENRDLFSEATILFLQTYLLD
ncbi:MAG: alpha/beta fold hydrolase, partial [Pseudomonadota bacterium]